jgi:hypothetical protein
MFLLSF